MSNLHIIYLYKKIFCFYFKFPEHFDESTGTLAPIPRAELFYSFYLTEVIVFTFGVVLAAFELLHAVKMAKTLAIVILIIAMIGCGFDVSLALVKARWCQYCVAFFNSLVNEYNDIQIGELGLRQ